MKIALFAITLALFASAVTDAVKLSLRQGANVGTTDKEANGGMGTQIIIQGSVKEPTEEVAAGQAISKCFLDAFNGDFSGLGLKLKELTVDTEVDVPEGDYDGMVTSERRHRRQDMPYISRYIWGFGIYNYKWG